MDIDDIENKLRQSRPRGAPPELREQILATVAPRRRPPFLIIAAMAALWLLVGLSHWSGLRTDQKFAEGRAPLDLAPPKFAKPAPQEVAKP